MYRTQRNYENAQRMLFDGVGQYGTPEIEVTQFDSAEFIGFNYARSAKNSEDKAVHFFLDDYQFNRVWTDPDRYIPMLQRFKYVLTPDFSLYTRCCCSVFCWYTGKERSEREVYRRLYGDGKKVTAYTDYLLWKCTG